MAYFPVSIIHYITLHYIIHILYFNSSLSYMYVYEYYFLALVRITTGTLLLIAFATSIVVMVA